MNHRCLLAAATIAVAAIVCTPSAQAGDRTRMGRIARERAQTYNWHGSYSYVPWNMGSPVALVVPPTAEFHTEWGWGVGNARATTIVHQYGLGYRGETSGGSYMYAPPWPSDTTQFGVYYVRGPW